MFVHTDKCYNGTLCYDAAAWAREYHLTSNHVECKNRQCGWIHTHHFLKA